MLVVDGSNVMGSRPDGWWRDRPAARQRLVDRLDDRVAATGEEVVVVFDGAEHPLHAVHVGVQFAPHADDVIAQLAGPGVTVVTSDRELQARARARGAGVLGAKTFGT